MIYHQAIRFRNYVPFAALCLLLAATIARADIMYVSEADGTIDEYNTVTGAYEGVFENGLSAGLNGPEGIALDTSGDLYVANYGDHNIMKFTPGGGPGTVFANIGSGVYGPINLAVNSSGDVFATCFESNTITEFSSSGNVLAFLASQSLSQPQGMTFDQSGNLFVASSGNNNILKYSSGAFTTAGQESFGQGPYDVAFDKAGNMYVANFNGTNIEKFTGGVGSLYDSAGLNSPDALEFDSQGDLFIANYYGNSITEITTNGVETTFASLGVHPYDIAIEPVPEPAVPILSLAGAFGIMALRWRQHRKA